MTVSSAVTAVDLLFGSRKIEGVLTGNRQRETRRSSSAPLRRFVIQGPYSRPSPSCIQFGRPVGAWRITAIVKIRPQAAGSFISCARAASAGSTATRFIENNARYVEYRGAEYVGLY